MHRYETSKKAEISREKELETVLKISQAVSRTLDLNKILDMACRMTAQALGVECCSIGMVTSKDIYEIVHSYVAEPPHPSIAGVKFDVAKDPHLTAAYFSGKPIHLFDMNKRSLSSMEMKLFKKLNLKVFLGIPIVVGGEVLGALHPGKVADPLPFSVSQIRLCQTIANQVGIAIKNAHLLKDLKDKYEQQSLLLEISQSLFPSLNPQQLLDIIIRETCKALKMDRCAIAIFELKGAHSVVRSVYFHRKPKSSAKSLLSTDYLGQVFRTASFKQFFGELEKGKRKYLLAEDVLSALSNQKARKYYRAAGVKSALIVPVFSDRVLAGLLNVSTMKDYHTFTDSEIKLCQTIANLASLALENANLMDEIKDKSERIRKQLKEEATLLDISRALSRTLNLQDLLKIVTRKAAELLGIERVAAMLVDESTGEIFSYTVFSYGRHQAEIEGAPENIKDFPVLMNCVRTKQLFCASDISRTKISPREMDYFKRRGVKSVLDIPFALGNRILGILALHRVKEYHEFTQSEIKVSQSIANQLSVAIENSRLMELLKERSRELEKLSLQVINAHEEERKNLARRLHDLVAQDLSATQLNLKLSQKALPGEHREIKARLKESEQLLNNAIKDLRDLTSNLRPPVLDDFGLASALQWYIERFNRRTDSKIVLKIGKSISKLPSEVETAIYRIIQEGLTNIAKHSQATRGVVSLDRKGDNLRVIIQDNGIGFDPESSSYKEGYGLFELRETAKLLGGTAKIFSKAGGGTKLVITLPFTPS